MSVVEVIGMGADGAAGIGADARARVLAADFLAGGERHLGFFPTVRAERFVLKDNVSDLLRELAGRRQHQRCVVLASGDPLCYGIGARLIAGLGAEAVRVEPALSSLQLAFARARIPWEGAALASIHGRPLRTTLLPLLGRALIGLFTHAGDSPAQVARYFLDCGLASYEAFVGEDLGAPGERCHHFATLDALHKQQFRPLNFLILRRTPAGECAEQEAAARRALVPGVPDAVFARPQDQPEVMTRQEVRSVVLGKLAGPTAGGDVAWDIGAGLGTVAIELAVLRPHLEVVAVERGPERAALLRRNRELFAAHNLRVLDGEAPEALGSETLPPRLVFVGGSGSRLEEILQLVRERLVPAGRLVASFVTLEHLAVALGRLREWQWPHEITDVRVARADCLGGSTGFKPQRGVFVLAATQPEGGA